MPKNRAEHLVKHQFKKGAGKVPEGHHPKQTYGQEQAEHWGAKAAGNPPAGPVKPANLSKPSGGRSAPQRNSSLRMSGHSGAHCLGKRK